MERPWYTAIMKIIPAIDLLGGLCVRLVKGNYNNSTVYSSSPAQTAREICASGCSRLHIVDLDAARNRGKNNREVIRTIRTVVPNVIIEVGGGIREEKDVENLLEIGVDRLILGTVFAKNPVIAEKWTKRYGSIFIAGIDALNGEVKISGWEESSNIHDDILAKKAAQMGIVSIIYTNISRDGTLTGPDIKNSIRIADSCGLPIIISGGISCDNDFKRITEYKNDSIAGVITGKALYEGKINLKKSVSLYDDGESGEAW